MQRKGKGRESKARIRIEVVETESGCLSPGRYTGGEMHGKGGWKARSEGQETTDSV